MELLLGFSELGRGDVAVAGGKGANLGELLRAGLPVPPGFVLTTEAYRLFLATNHLDDELLSLARSAGEVAADTAALADQIRALFAAGELPDDIRTPLLEHYADLGGGPVAVRSSATAEDLAEASFAGQQESFLNVRGTDELLAAVRECWASLWTPRAIDYRAHHDVEPDAVALAVVVQQMVEADSSGVLFTANPDTGRRDELMIAAAWGLGESVVGGSVDADQLVVGAADRAVRSRRIGDKTVRTVYAGQGTEEVPVGDARRHQPVLDDEAAARLAALGLQAAAHFGSPQDLEWVRVADRFAIVQSRPITALPQPIGPVPDEWPVPDSAALYFRASIVEQLPDPLSPLFAELAAVAVPSSVRQMMREFSGRDLIRPDQVGFPTINGYAYYRYSRAGMSRMLLASPALLRQMVSTGSHSIVERWRTVAHPRYVATVRHWQDTDLTTLGDADLLDGLRELVEAGARYYTSVQTIIPLAATSEILLTRFYDAFLRRPGDPPASALLLGFDSAPIRADKSLHDLADWTASLPTVAAAISGPSAAAFDAALGSGEPPAGVADAEWRAWRARLDDHLQRFGHTVYNLDPVNPVPADDPTPLLGALRYALSGADVDPYARQARSTERRERLSADLLARADPVRGRVLGALLAWAQAAGPVREDALADVGLAWPRLRAVARELGDRLVAAGALDSHDDVYWLHVEEIERAGHAGPPSTTPLTTLVAQRREVWRGRRRANPPQMLPALRWMTWMESMLPAASIDQTGDEIRGTAGSPGQVTGVARVLDGPQDFGRLQPGEVLVAGITTPAWTPLFALAAAVVTDIGGPLSHSSIVAREYGIPAVLGTGVATRRIPDGVRVRVDGDRGTVRLLDPAEDAPEPTPTGPVRPGHRPFRAVLVAGVLGATAIAVLIGRRLRGRAAASIGARARAGGVSGARVRT